MEDRALRVGIVQRVHSGGFVSCFRLGLHAGVSLTGMVLEDLIDL